MIKILFTIKIPFKGLFDSIIFYLINSYSKQMFCYVFACTCKKTNPKANPKRVITKQAIAVLKISLIISKN